MMHLANDCIHPYEGATGVLSRCRVRVYLSDDGEQDAPVVIASELANNPGASITNAAEFLAAEIMRSHLLERFVWIEHRPPESTDGRSETFELVVFAHYEPEQVRIGGALRAKLGEPRWKRLDRATVEVARRPADLAALAT